MCMHVACVSLSSGAVMCAERKTSLNLIILRFPFCCTYKQFTPFLLLGSISFYGSTSFCLFTHLLMDVCFIPQFFFLTMISQAAVDIHIQVFLWTIFWFPLGKYLAVEELGQMVGVCLTLAHCRNSFKSGFSTHQQFTWVLFPLPLPSVTSTVPVLGVVSLLKFSHFNRCVVGSLHGFNFHFSDYRHLASFHVSNSHLFIFTNLVSISYWTVFYYWVVGFLYILNVSFVRGMCCDYSLSYFAFFWFLNSVSESFKLRF